MAAGTQGVRAPYQRSCGSPRPSPVAADLRRQQAGLRLLRPDLLGGGLRDQRQKRGPQPGKPQPAHSLLTVPCQAAAAGGGTACSCLGLFLVTNCMLPARPRPFRSTASTAAPVTSSRQEAAPFSSNACSRASRQQAGDANTSWSSCPATAHTSCCKHGRESGPAAAAGARRDTLRCCGMLPGSPHPLIPHIV